jgi:TetR/AcrR family transcriptional repressor of bet genes
VSGRQGNRELRRLQLIEAAISVIGERGLQEATVGQIAAAAGFTGANLYRYFGDKDGLVEASMRHVVELVAAGRRRLLAEAHSAEDSLQAAVRAYLAPEVFRVDLCRAWIHFCAQAPHAPALARLERLHGRLRSRSLRQAALRFLPEDAAAELVDDLAAMLDGLWVQRAQVDEGLSPAEAWFLVAPMVSARCARLKRG